MPDTITAAVPQQTPPQDAILHPAQVYFLSRRLPGIVHLVQYDQSLPYLAVELYEGDELYTVPDGAAVNIRMAKPVPSDKKVYNPAYGLSEDRHTVYIAVTPQMTVVAGCTNPVIEVVVDGGVACTGTLRLEIDPNPVQESDLIDTDEYKTLEEILAEAQAAAQIVQDNEQALQDVHNNLSAIQNAAANAQAAAASAQDAEDAADRAAIESQKALGFRSYFGGQVVPGTDGDLDPSRPMSTPTAASVTIKARGDRIAGLTMAGKTTQAGTGDPSPENVRMISGVGRFDKMVVVDGSKDFGTTPTSSGDQRLVLTQYISIKNIQFPVTNDVVGEIASSQYPAKTAGNTYASVMGISVQGAGPNAGGVFIYDPDIQTNEAAKAYFQSHPLIIWYRSVDYAKSKGPFYTVVELSDDPYRAVGFELNQPLFDGDSLKVGGKSGFDKMVVLDGSNDGLDFDVSNNSGLYSFSTPIAERNGCRTGFLRYDELFYSNLGASSFGVYISGDSSGINFRLPSDVALNSGAYKSYLQSHPLTVFYRSVDYTEENDIPVALESHVMGYRVWDGTGGMGDVLNLGEVTRGNTAVELSTKNGSGSWAKNASCSHFRKLDNWTSNTEHFYINRYFYLFVANSRLDSTDLAGLQAWLAAQYSAGTPVQVVYEIATPVSYARPVPTMIAQPGEDGTFTVTGENSLSVLLKAFQDGGDAATIEGHTWADILAAIQAATASTANALLEEKTNV